MSTTTTSNYISKIDQNYPTAGRDNDSQGFRTNFTNIVGALKSANADIDNLTVNSVKLNETNDFGFNTVKRAIFQNCGDLVYDNSASAVSGEVVIDYSAGSYQKFKLDSGTTNFTVVNFPGDLQSGHLLLSVTTSTNFDTFVNFSSDNLYNLSSEVLPMKITGANPTIFDIKSDGTSGNLFVKRLNDTILSATTRDINSTNVTGTNVTAVQKLVLGSNTYTLDSDFNTVVTNSGVMGKIALFPKQTVATITGSIGDLFGGNSTSTFQVSSANGITVGAKFSFAGTSTVFTVTGIDSSKISTQPFRIDQRIVSEGDAIIFTNPQFNNQPNLLSMINSPPSSLKGAPGDLKGQVYANSTTLFVSFSDYQQNTQNWFAVQSASSFQATITTAPVTDKSTTIATTAFVHNIMPYGTLIMWSGAANAIPTGWALCDGTNGTPDLRDRFVVGAGKSYAVGASGGSANAIIPAHSHTASSTVTDPGHTHTYRTATSTAPQSGSSTQCYFSSLNQLTTDSSKTGITVATTVDSVGTSVTNANLPPYLALCYIMKITGQ